MGADFVEKATPTFKKSWDRERVLLGTADLFTRQPSCIGRTAAAEVVTTTKLEVGDQLTVEPHGLGLVARRGNAEVAHFVNPPADIIKAVTDSCGIAKGVVEQVHDLAGIVEISLC